MVPNGWKCSPLKSLIDSNRKITYGVLKPDTPEGSSCALMIRSSDYTYGWISNDEIMPISCQLDKEYKRSRVSTGDILLTVVGANIGTVATVPERLDGSNISRAVARISVDETKAHTAFVTCFLKSSEVQKFIYSSAVGGAQPVINLKELGLFKVPLPPLPEQKKIARILSTWDQAIETMDKLIENSKQQKKALMQQLLTGKKRLPGFSGEWKTIKLNKLCNVRRGASPRPISDAKWFADEGRGWIRIADATASESRYLTETTQKLSPLGVEKSVSVDPGDLIMSICGTIGVPRILSIAACIHDGFVVFRDYADKLHLEFLCHYLNLFTLHLANSGQPGTQKNLNTTIVGNLEVPLIAIEEQIAIANVLNKAEEHALSLQKEHDMLTVQKQALMQQLLTGKRRVKVDDDRSLAQAGQI